MSHDDPDTTKDSPDGPTAYSSIYRGVDFREHPDRYRIGRGEQGVLLAEPYKSELLPLWRFRTPEIAQESADALYQQFLTYRNNGDFVGMDMARKYLQMGYTRSRRYANHRTGQKYDGPVPEDKKGQSGAHGRDPLPLDPDPVKARSALIFKEKWLLAKQDPVYRVAAKQHQEQHEMENRGGQASDKKA